MRMYWASRIKILPLFYLVKRYMIIPAALAGRASNAAAVPMYPQHANIKQPTVTNLLSYDFMDVSFLLHISLSAVAIDARYIDGARRMHARRICLGVATDTTGTGIFSVGQRSIECRTNSARGHRLCRCGGLLWRLPGEQIRHEKKADSDHEADKHACSIRSHCTQTSHLN